MRNSKKSVEVSGFEELSESEASKVNGGFWINCNPHGDGNFNQPWWSQPVVWAATLYWSLGGR